ncbi:UDP-glycosyltransferase UGT5 [Amyelois transitella]|uniref:UDP-glycosyltransferase UGT5 n=1 Tax=Amyelois transitella TaxID=680683 RepID=UPI00299061BB|nr:UDP-glycosyltransferase UGT5 [Amyelois transitella]
MYNLVLLVFIICVTQYEAARIFGVFPTPSISHQVTFRPLIQELVKKGHEVVVLTTDPAFTEEERPKNLTEIDVHDVSYHVWVENFKSNMDTSKKSSLKNQIRLIYEMMTQVFEMQMNLDVMQEIIKKKIKPFDLILVEAYMLPALGFSHVFKVPVIQMSSFLPVYSDIRNIGAHDHPLLYPALGRQKLDNLSLLDKVKELYNHYSMDSDTRKAETFFDESVKRIFGPDVPDLSELYNNIDMLFLNTFPIWDSNRPVPPSVQYLGGIHMKPVKELPEDLKSYLDSSKHGVVYVSFGTNVNASALPPEKIQMMINVLSRSPYDVLWKWDKDELPGQTKNIRISKWLPQSDLLRHPKIKFFITQGGLQSTDEAIVAGVPLLGIPMLGDQWYNVAMYERHKIGVKMELEDLEESNFKEAIHALTKDESYRQNIIRLRSIVYDQPQTPLERAVWWTEHVLRHGGARHLRSPAANLPWTVYYEVELVAYALLVVTSAISVFVFLAWKVRRVVHLLLMSNLKSRNVKFDE